MKKLVEDMGFEGFYIWFNTEKKEEYILTPNFLFGNIENVNMEVFSNLKIIGKRNSNSIATYKLQDREVLKYPFIRFTPYVERLGLMLVRFLNTDFSNFTNAYDNFYYVFGTELLEIYSKSFKLNNKYSSEELLLNAFKKLHENIKDKVISIQKDYKKIIDFLFNLNGNNEYIDKSAQVKFTACMIKNKNNILKYTNSINIINYTYSDKLKDEQDSSFDDVISDLSYDISMLRVSDIYTSNDVGNILFVELNQIIQNNDIIKTCQNCGRYFIPNKSNEIYCDFLKPDGTTCRNKGAGATYKKNLENVPALLEYRRTYNRKLNTVSRNKENKELKEDFDKWKKAAQKQIRLYKQELITEEDLYDWMIKNK